MRYCSFDLEIAKQLEGDDWKSQRPFGISCAATICTGDEQPVLFYHGLRADGCYGPHLTREQCQDLVHHLAANLVRGFVPLTWNGLSFDFDVLAEESGMHQECADLAMHHVDMMFQIVCTLGYPVGLDACLASMGLPGKQGMTGAEAPRIWRTDPAAVLAYVSGDVTGPLALAEKVERGGHIRWLSKNNRPMWCGMDHWLTVEECLTLPVPDTSWMTEPRPREAYYSWINDLVSTKP